MLKWRFPYTFPILFHHRDVLGGPLDLSGVLRHSRLYDHAMGGTLGSSSELIIKRPWAVGGTLGMSSVLTLWPRKTLGRTLTTQAVMTRYMKRDLAGALSFVGDSDRWKKYYIVLTGTLSTVGTATKQIHRRILRTLYSTSQRSAATLRSLSGTITPTATLTSIRTVPKYLTATLSTTANTVRKSFRTILRTLHLSAETHYYGREFSIGMVFTRRIIIRIKPSIYHWVSILPRTLIRIISMLGRKRE